MLSVSIKPHRGYLRADAPGQKLFVLLRLRPSVEAARARPGVALAVVIDTNGSMRERVP